MDATDRKHQTLCAEEEKWIKLVDKRHLHSMLKHLLGQYYFRILYLEKLGILFWMVDIPQKRDSNLRFRNMDTLGILSLIIQTTLDKYQTFLDYQISLRIE